MLFRSIILSWQGIDNKKLKIEVIPCCADLKHFSRDRFDEKTIEEAGKKLGISKNDFVLSYIGSLGTWYLLDEMMKFFKRLIYQKPEAKFLFITQENPQKIYETAEKNELKKNVIVVKSASREEVPLYTLLSDLSVFFIKSSFSKTASSPTKMGELLGLGIPVITNPSIGEDRKSVV